MTWTTAGEGKTNLVDVAIAIGAGNEFRSVVVTASAATGGRSRKLRMNLRDVL